MVFTGFKLLFRDQISVITSSNYICVSSKETNREYVFSTHITKKVKSSKSTHVFSRGISHKSKNQIVGSVPLSSLRKKNIAEKLPLPITWQLFLFHFYQNLIDLLSIGVLKAYWLIENWKLIDLFPCNNKFNYWWRYIFLVGYL